MIKRFLKSSVIFFVILGVSFSNLPFYALSGLIDSYEKTSGIVDKIWLVQQNRNSDVVDNFSSLRNISEKLKVQEAMAAANFIGNSNIVYTNGGVPTAITPNASTINGDLLVFYHYSRATGGNETVTLPAGFTTVFNSVTANYGLVAVGWLIKQAGDTTFTATITNHTSGTSGETVVEFIQTYRGTDTTSPIVNYTAALSTWASGLNVGPIAAPATATVTDGDMAVVFGGKFENTTGQTVLSGDSLTWTIRTTLNTTLGLDAGGVVQTGLNASGSDKTVTAKTVTTTGTAQVGAGRMFIIKKAPDTTPPTPDPMTFATAPANDSTTQISMIATTATDATTPPVSYFFTLDNTNCGASAGTGGTSSAWQAGTSYSDSGLTANKCYGYTVKARDSMGTPNETGVSGIFSAYTSANTPGTPTLGSPTTNTLSLTNAENSNPTANPTTNYAVQVVTTSDGNWFNKWVDGSGSPSASEVWLTDAQLDALVLQGLQASTLYGVKVKARNQDTDETPLGAEGQGTTSAPSVVLTVGISGSQTANADSGATTVSLGGAFTFIADTGSDSIASIKVSNNGDAGNLSNVKLYYDSSGNGYGGGDDTLFGTGTLGNIISGSMAISITMKYVYVVADISNAVAGGKIVDLQISNPSTDVVTGASNTDTNPKNISGTTTIRPNVIDATDSSLGDGGRNGDTFTITGTGFGTACGAVSVQVEGTSLTCNSANNTTISATIPSTQTTTYGGTGASGKGLLVTIGGTADDTRWDYYIYPDVTAAPAGDAGRETENITIGGKRFGSTQGTINFVGSFGNIPASVGAWGDTSVTVVVPNAIADNIYLGDIKITRASDTDFKDDLTYGSDVFKVLPRITLLNPSSGPTGTDVTISGDHLCQTGTCPAASSWNTANDDGHDVEWDTTDAAVLSTPAEPTHTTIYVDTPSIGGGAYTVAITSGGGTPYTSNGLTFTGNFAPTLSISQPDGVSDTVTVGDLYNITYTLSDTDNIVTAAFYYDTDATGLNGTAITGACATAAEGAGATCSWDTTGITSGGYYVYGLTSDGVNPQVSAYSSGQITINAPPQVTVSSVGTLIANIDAGDTTTKYLGATFRFQQNSGVADTITALTVSETGTVNANANLSANAGVRYETGVASCTYNGTETLVSDVFDVTTDKMILSGLSIPVTVGSNYTCIYVVFDVSASAVGGQTIDMEITSADDFTLQNSTTKAGTYPAQLAGSTTIRPNITSITSYPDATQSGGKIGQTVQIAGAGFGTTCDGTNNKVQIGTYALSCAGASFNNTTISVPINSGINVYGGTGSNGLLATIGGVDDNIRQEYYILPNITVWPGGDAAREGDNITFGGTRFGATEGTINFTGNFGNIATSVVSWGDTSITVVVPTAISDSIYTGDITITRAADTNSKYTAAYGSNTFRILPIITQINPNSGATNDPVVIIGNHLCQTGNCPLAGSRSTSSDNATFYNSIQVADGNVTAWGHGDSSTSGVSVNVPAAAETGNVVVKSNNYDSNGVNFTKQSSAPTDPTSLYQFETNTDLDEPPADYNSLTETNPAGKVAVGGGINQTNVWLRATAQAGINATLCIEVEVKTVVTAFDGTGAVLGTSPDGCKSFTVGTPVKLFVEVAGLTNNSNYKWRARIKNQSTSEYGNWINASVDGQAKSFYIDNTGPALTPTCPPSTYTASSADIAWQASDGMGTLFTKQVQYGTDSSFATSFCTPGATCGTPISGLSSGSQSVSISGLAPNTAYYYRARSKDAAGNETVEGYGLNGNTTCTVTTSKANMRTVEYIITGEQDFFTTAMQKTFQVYVTEQGYNIQNAFIELSGIVEPSGTNMSLGLKVEGSNTGLSYANYDVATSATVSTPFTILHKVDPTASGLYVAPVQANNNILFINPNGKKVYIAAAKITVTYYYTP